MEFRKHIEDDSVLAKFIKSFGLIKVTVPSDTTEYELSRLRVIADKINFFNHHTAKIDIRYEIVIQEVDPIPEPVEETVIEEPAVVEMKRRKPSTRGT